MEESKVINKAEVKNKWANTGLILGIISIFFGFIGIIPLVGIFINAVGISKSKNLGGKGKVQAIIGLVLSIVYMLNNMRNNGYI